MKQLDPADRRQFKGFPARMQYTPVPNLFFSGLLPEINDIDELRTTLHIIRAVYAKRGPQRFVTRGELLADKSLMDGLRHDVKPSTGILDEALEMAVKRGTVIRLTLDAEGKPEDVFFLNGEAERRMAEKIKNGEMVLGGLKASGRAMPESEPAPDIFAVYEQNIGMLTPMIAEELREAEKLYPPEWIRDAVKEAVSLNKRNWRYIERILENWANEGRGDGTYRGDTKTNPDKFSGQKYGHMVQR